MRDCFDRVWMEVFLPLVCQTFLCFVLGRNDGMLDLLLNFFHKIAIMLWAFHALMKFKYFKHLHSFSG